MSKEIRAVICPVCRGSGAVAGPLGTNTAGFLVTCHGCGGHGWVNPDGPADEVLFLLKKIEYNVRVIALKMVEKKP